MTSASSENDPVQNEAVVSPFSDAEPQQPALGRKKNAPALWIGATVVILAVLGLAAYFAAGALTDPLRTLERFPVTNYMENHRPLEGAKFRADLRVENDLGWKEGVGRLMVFTLSDDPRPIVVMIPPDLAETYFSKGQRFAAELEVKEGGLIHANTLRKD